MVGVAGRSKACNTCRKRRIACSLERPECSQCIKSKRVCLGYHREQVWVRNNQVTVDTYVRNKPITPVPPTACVEYLPVQKGNAMAMPLASATGRPSPVQSGTLSALPLRLAKTVDPYLPFQQQLLSEFLYNYIPDNDRSALSSITKNDRSWLLLIPTLTELTKALEMSILAVSTAKLGRLHENTVLIETSRKLYGQSLRELQKALWDPKLMYRDETLAACMALSMYEVIECPSENGKGWITHSNGCLRLIELRGPNAHTSGLGHQLFIASRFSSLIQALPLQRSNFLSKPEWIELPWKGQEKTLSNNLEDVFVRGITLLESAQRLPDLPTDKFLLPALEIVERCWKIDSELREVYKELEDSALGPLYWPELSTIENPADDDPQLGKVFPVAFTFVNFRAAHMCNLYWALSIILWDGLGYLYQALASLELPAEDEDGSPDECHCTTPRHICGQHAKYFHISQLPSLQGRDVMTAARYICQSFEYCTRPDMRGMGAASVAFPLQVAIGVLKAHPTRDRELRWARAAVQKINDDFRILKYAENE